MQHAAAQIVDELAQREPDRRFEHARLLHVTADAVEARAPVARQAAVIGPSFAAHAQDVGHRCDGLDVVDDRRRAERTLDRGKRWLEARLATLALERVQERGLFTTNVRT